MASSFGKMPKTSVHPLDFAVEAFDGFGRVQPGAVLLGECHEANTPGLVSSMSMLSFSTLSLS